MNGNHTLAIPVIGAGSWGTALAMLLARNGHRVPLWDHDPEHVERLRGEGENARYLPGIPLPEGILPTASLEEALEGADLLLVVVPSHVFRHVLESLRPLMRPDLPLLWATKGLEQGTTKLLHQVVEETVGEDHPCAVISGPTFAGEVARGMPSAVTVASTDDELSERVARALHNSSFRAYTSDDVVGVEIGGAVKNVMAIAAGIADGLGFGANARAALITRGLAEIQRLGLALGARQSTFLGLAGVGDLVLTCTDDQSRNRRFGLALARGASEERAREEIGQVVEGAGTTEVVHRLAMNLGIEMPITRQVYEVLYRGGDPREAVQALFSRALKPEEG